MKRGQKFIAITAAVFTSIWLLLWLQLRARLVGQDLAVPSLRSRRRVAEQSFSLFGTAQHQREAFRIYSRQQDFEYRALKSALRPHQWQEAIALEFDTRQRGVPSRRSTARHRLIWDVFGPFYNCPLQERVGTPSVFFDGGKWLCGVKELLQGPKCVVYSFGSNGEVSFERALIGMTHGACEVHVFDFSLSPKQVQQVQAIHGVTFHDYGIGADDRVVTDPFVYEARNVTSYELKSLPTIMAELGHEWIDVLKMDVEGAEYGILQAIVHHYQNVKQVIPVTQAQVEYHHHDEQPSRHDLLTTLILFERSGFRAFHQEYNYHGEPWHYVEYAYLHVDDHGKIMTPATADS